jgi:hypothetical protein
MPILGIMASQISGHLWAPAGAYDALATVTLSAATASIEFTGIPAGYKHLQVRAIARATASGGATGLWFLNSDTTQSNYYSHFLVGNGSTATAAAYNNPYSWSYTDSANVFPAFVMDILDYANTNKYKTIRTLRGWDANGSGNVSLESGLWKNTNAVTTFKFNMDTGNLAQYSSFALYGVR